MNQFSNVQQIDNDGTGMTGIIIVIGATGMISKSFKHDLDNVPCKISLLEMQNNRFARDSENCKKIYVN